MRQPKFEVLSSDGPLVVFRAQVEQRLGDVGEGATKGLHHTDGLPSDSQIPIFERAFDRSRDGFAVEGRSNVNVDVKGNEATSS